MSTRITSNMISRSVLTDLNDIAAKQAATRRQMSSGKAITRPSDDPYLAGRAMSLRGELDRVKQHEVNVQEAQGWMTVTDTALGQIGDMANLARGLVVQGSTDALPQTSRDALAGQIDQIIAGMKQEANATYDGRYVLGGNKTANRPYDSSLTGTDDYNGDYAVQPRDIGPGVSINVNVVGANVLGDSASGDKRLLGVLRDVAAHLRSGDTASLGTTDLKALDAQIDNLLAVRAGVGAGMNRLTTAENRLAELEESALSMLSEAEDADMAKTLTDFSTQQAVYQSALNAGARIVQASLLDFLR
jgi:flagellar hook-associated protein 3 FlgL